MTPPFATARSWRASRSRLTTSCASPSSSTTSAWPSSREAGRAPTPRTTSSSSEPAPNSTCRSASWSPSAPLGGPGARSTPTRCWPTWPGPARRRCASSGSAGTTTSPRPCRPPWTRVWPWWPTRWSSWWPQASGCSLTPSTSSTASAATPSSACGCWRPRPWRERPPSCCATPTAARFLTTSPRRCRRWRPMWTVRSASTCTTTPAAVWPTRWPRCRPGRFTCRAPSTATGSGSATAT